MRKQYDSVIPIPFEQLTEIFELEAELPEGEKLMVGVSYNECEYKGKKLLYYIANVEVEIDLAFSGVPNREDSFENPPTFQDALDLLVDYMHLDRISSVNYLNNLAAYVLATYGGYDLSTYFGSFADVYDDEKIAKWIEDNKEVVHRWYTFFHSLPVFMIETHSEVKKIFPPDEVYTEIDDVNYVSLNVINLVKMPGFVDYILVPKEPCKEIFIFKEQFNEPIYNGKNLYHYLMEVESQVFAACISLFNGQTSLEDLRMVEKAANEAEAASEK